MPGDDSSAPHPVFAVSAGEGHVRVRWRRGLRITGPHVLEAMAAVDSLNAGRERPLLVEMAGVLAPTRDARQLFGRRCTASRVALLGESAVDRVAASFVPSPGVQGFPVPTRFFTCEARALEWLLAADVTDQAGRTRTPPTEDG